MTSTLQLQMRLMHWEKRGRGKKAKSKGFGHVISRTQTNKLTNKWFLWNTLPGHTRALICCVCYEGWKAAIITDDCFLAEGWHKELPSIFIICFELWGRKTGLVHEQYFHYNEIIPNESMVKTCMFSIMHKKSNLYRQKCHKKLQAVHWVGETGGNCTTFSTSLHNSQTLFWYNKDIWVHS